MELCYIWVEQFRNIVKQGFNLSSKYSFEYKPEVNRLTVSSNTNYIENFFGDTISNVTGIIGENAAGKTNLLELLNFIFRSPQTKGISNPILIFHNNGSLFGYCYENKWQPISENVEFHSWDKLPRVTNIFYSNVFDGRKHSFDKETIDLSTNSFLYKAYTSSFLSMHRADLKNQITFLESEQFNRLSNAIGRTNEQNNLFDIETLYPRSVLLQAPQWKSIIDQCEALQYNYNSLTGQSDKGFSEFVNSIKKKIRQNESSGSQLRYLTVLLHFISYILYESELSKLPTFRSVSRSQTYYPKALSSIEKSSIIKFYESFNFELLKDDRIDSIVLFISNRLKSIQDSESNATFQEMQFALESLLNSEVVENITERKYSGSSELFRIDYKSKCRHFLKYYLLTIKDKWISYSFDWEGISSGHKAMLTLFSRLNDVRRSLAQRQSELILFTIDEGDLYFHPLWQIQYFYILVNAIPEIIPGTKNVQIVLSSHSPFIVSDLPRNNLIFLEKKDRMLKVKSREELPIKTFGGNIGELFIDAFFMKNQVISEFAASKIRDVVVKVKKDEELSHDDQVLIDLIGNEFISKSIKGISSGKNTKQ